MQRLLVALVAVVVAASADPNAPLKNPVAHFSVGDAVGQAVHANKEVVHVFKGIPFAEAPVGERRFAAPSTKKPWNGVLNANKYAAPCFGATGRKTAAPSEDCLHLDLFADARCMNTSCPVLVYIHGETEEFGNPQDYPESSYLYFASQRLIIATITYRSGVFGYANLGAELKDAPLNVGLLDMIEAIHFLRAELPAVGGDPERLTLMGTSDSAAAIEFLLASPAVRPGLFQRAILSSPMPVLDAQRNLNATTAILKKTGCAEQGAAAQQLKCLRTKEAAELHLATPNASSHWQRFGPQPDNALLPSDTFQSLLRRYWKPTKILISTTSREHALELDQPVEHLCAEAMRILGLQLDATVEACAQRYKKAKAQLLPDLHHALTNHVARQNQLRGEQSFLQVFEQRGHLGHAADFMFAFRYGYPEEPTFNQIFMEWFYGRMLRNVVKGMEPSQDWEPVDAQGRNYYSTQVEVEHANQLIIPHTVAERAFDEPAIKFWLEELPSVERRNGGSPPLTDPIDSFPHLHNHTPSDQELYEFKLILGGLLVCMVVVLTVMAQSSDPETWLADPKLLYETRRQSVAGAQQLYANGPQGSTAAAGGENVHKRR